MEQKKTVQQSKKNKLMSTQLHLNIAEVRDNVFMLKNG